MRLLPGLALIAIGLGGCGDAPDRGPAARHGGRYVGIGIYHPGPLWQRMAVPDRAGDGAAATLRDDEQIIVVVDSRTGEIRQCGNLSGHCIRSNPWSGQPAPVRLTEHAADIEQAEAANAAAPEPARR